MLTRIRVSMAVSAISAVFLFAAAAQAANLTWDAGGTHPLAPVDGSGNWDSTTAWWSNGVTDIGWDNLSTAVFGNNNGAAGTVTIDDVSGTVTAAGLTFNAAGSGNYTIAASGADTLTLTGTSPVISIAAGLNPTISAPITGSFNSYANGTTITGLLIKGTGTLTLSGNNTYTGSTIIESNGVANTGTAVILTGGSLGSSGSNIYVGLNPTAAAPDTSSLTLSGTSAITAASLVVDFNFGLGNISTAPGAVLNVNGNNTINANNIVLPAGRNNGNTKGGIGTLQLGSGATLALHDAANDGGAVTLLDIANYSFETGGGTGTGTTGVVDLSAGSVNGTIATINIGTGKAGSANPGNGGTATGSLLFSNGALSATTINIARLGSQAGAGTLTLVAGGTGTINAGSITIGATGQGTQATNTKATGIIQINGGTLALAGAITANPNGSALYASGGSTATINLNGGTLDMGNNAIGDSSNAISLVATAGTLKNVSSINASGGLTMSGTGAQVLTLTGTNAYSGITTVNGGTLVANGAASMGTGGALAVNGGTLDLAGFNQSVAGLSGTGATGVITNGGSGASTSTLTISGGTGTYLGVIQNGTLGGKVALSVTGGTTTLASAAAQTYTGNTTVGSGAALTVANFNSSTAVAINGALAAGGNVGTILIDAGGALTPGPTVASGNTGTLAATSLTIGSGGGILNFRANSALAVDKLSLTGAATLNGGLTVNATLSGSMASGTYDLLTAPGGLLLNGNTVAGNVSVGGGGSSRVSGLIQETATKIQLVVSGNPATLTWTGSADTTSWDIGSGSHQNWTSAAPSDPNRFYNQDNVIFGNASNLNVNISAATVLPGSITFNNDAAHNYVISSSGGFGIADSGSGTSLTMSGAGTVTLNTTNTYAGPTNVHLGTLIVGATGSVGGSALTVDSGAATVVNTGGSLTPATLNINGALTAGGAVGGDTLAIGATGTATVATNGTVSSTTLTVNGGSLTVQSGGTLSSPTVNITAGSATVQSSGSYTGSSLSVASGAAFTVQSGGSLTNTPNLTNNGTVTLNSDQTIGALSGTDAGATITQTGTLTVGQSGAFAGVIKDGGSGNLTVAGGTLTLTGANLYTGSTTINSGATLIVDSGANTGSLSAATAITDNGTLVYGRTGTQSVPNVLTGSGAFRQNGGGTMSLTADNSGFSGAIQAYSGTVLQTSATSLGTGGGGYVLGTPQPAGAPVATPTGNITLISSVPSTTVGSISSTTGSDIASPTPNIITVPSGVTLTDTGNLTVGSNNSTGGSFSTLALTGGGALVVNGTVNVSQTNSVAVLDLSGLNSATVNTTGAFNIVNGAGLQGTVNLANTTVGNVAPVNSITAGSINIATTATNNPNGNSSVLNLGYGSNSLFANTINLGTGRGSAIVQFAAGAPSTASVTIADSTGTGSAAIVLCNASTNGNQGGTGSFLNLAGFTANVQASSLIIAEHTGNLSGGAIAGVTFDKGTFNVAGTVTIAADTGGSSTVGPTGSLTIGGSTPNNTATGTFTTTGNVVLGNFTNGNAFAVAGTATATFTINGGIASIGGNIVSSSTQGNTLATLNLNGGRLDLNGNAIGGNGGVNSGNGPITVNLPAAGQTATLANLGSGGINGAGLTMASGGKLILAGANTYSGNTTIGPGTLLVNGTHTGGDNYMVGSNGVLGGTGTITTAGPNGVTVGAGGAIAPGDGLGTLSVVGPVNFATSSVLSTHLLGSQSSVLDTTAGTLNVDTGAVANFALLGNLTRTSYLFAKYTGTLGGTSGQFSTPTFTVPSGVPTPTGAAISNNTVAGTLTLTVSPQSLRGNFNLDNQVDASDVPAMLSALTDLNHFLAIHPTFTNTDLLALGDFDNSGSVTNRDIQPMLDYIAGLAGGGSIAAVPEPASILLVTIGLAAASCSWVGRRRSVAAFNRSSAPSYN